TPLANKANNGVAGLPVPVTFNFTISQQQLYTPLNFTNPNFIRLPANQEIEEETISGYIADRYYSTRIKEILKERYQVVEKLEFGASSTSISMEQQLNNKLNIYKYIEEASQNHSDCRYIRLLLDSFNINGSKDIYHCLVHLLLWKNVLIFLLCNPNTRLFISVQIYSLSEIFFDYLFMNLLDIKADNIIFDIVDDSVFCDFEENKLQNPYTRKKIDRRTIYIFCYLRISNKLDISILCDFDSAVLDNKEYSKNIQSDIYQAPEVILETL
ncbi:uncharacterized protein N7469_011676, partial [Penicillium citrinum]